MRADCVEEMPAEKRNSGDAVHIHHGQEQRTRPPVAHTAAQFASFPNVDLLIPKEDFNYPEDELFMEENESTWDETGPQKLPSLSRRASWRRKARRRSLRSRVETLQHQLGKPFRALSVGKRFVSRSASLDCTGLNVMRNVLRSHEPCDESMGSPPATSSEVKTESRPGPEHSKQIVPEEYWDVFHTEEAISIQDWWNDRNVAVLHVSEEKDNTKAVRWLYSGPRWSSGCSSTIDPPGRHSDFKDTIPFDTETLITTRVSMDSADGEIELVITENDLD